MTSAGSNMVNPLSAAQHMFGIGAGPASSASDPQRWLGPEPGTLQTNPYDRVPRQNFAYPEAVKDQNLFVKQSITGFIMENVEWMTTLALPWAETDQLVVAWNEWHFNNPLANRVPHEGVSQMITSSKSAHKTHVVRRGLAFMMEGDYSRTPEGVYQYGMNVALIGQAVQETQNHDTVYALLNCKNYAKMWEQRFGKTTVSMSAIADNEIETFGSVCLPEGDDRLVKVVEDYKRLMRKQGVVPDLFIAWPGASIYMTVNESMRTSYDKGGPDGVMRRAEGPTAMTSFRGMAMFEARDFDVYQDAPHVQLLTRPIQISEYYTMRFDRRHEDCSNYETKERGIVLYDENTNQWKKITFMEAFNHTNIFNSAGDYSMKLVALVNSYREAGRRAKVEKMTADTAAGDDVDDAESGGPTALGEKPSFFLTAPDNDGEYMLIRYFGQMEAQHMTPEDVQRIAETIAAPIVSPNVVNIWRDLIVLLTEIEAQPYNDLFWRRLIEENTPAGGFVGEATPMDLMEHGNLSRSVTQWKGNDFGSLNLPQGTADDDLGAFPSGYANGPGLRTLAAEADKQGSRWQAVGRRARACVDLLTHIIDHLRARLKTSAAIDEKGRSPWFHRADALSTFVETVVGARRSPLFLLSLPPVNFLSSAPFNIGNHSPEAPVKWFALPGTVAGIPKGMVFKDNLAGVISALRGTAQPGDGVSTAISGLDPSVSNIVFYSPTLGSEVVVPVADFATVRLAPELRAFGMLPGGDSQIEQDVRLAYYKAAASLTNVADRRKLNAFIYNMGLTRARSRMWQAVYGMAGMTEEALAATVSTLYLDNPTAAQASVARAEVANLVAIAPNGPWDSYQTLSIEFDKLATAAPLSAPFSGAGISMSDPAVGDEIERLFVLEAELETLSKGFSGIGAFDRAAVAAASPKASHDAPRVNQLKLQIDGVLSRIGINSARVNIGANSAREFIGVDVSAESYDIANAQYYRTPLTSSSELVRGISGSMGGASVGKPLVLPADTVDDTVPYVVDEGETMFHHGDKYGPMIGAVMRAPNYASIPEMLSVADKFRLADTGFAKRHEQANFASSYASKASAFAHFEDSSDEEGVGYSAAGSAQLFANPHSSAFKRPRVADHFIGNKASASAQAAADREASTIHRAEYKYTHTGTFARRWKQSHDIAHPIVRMCARAFLMTNCETKGTWTAMIQNDILVPMDIVLWRPLIVHDMASCIMMKGGIETGANLHGGSNVARGNDVTSKLIYFNFTFRSKAVVWKEKNVAIIENVKFEGYGGGMNTEFIVDPKDLEREDQKRPSIIATAMGLNEKPLEKRMHFSGVARSGTVNEEVDGPRSWQYASAEYYDEFCYRLSSSVATLANPGQDSFVDRSARVTLASYQGTQFSYNRNSGAYSRFVEPQGFLKRNMCYPGAAAVLNGTAKSFANYNYDMVRIE